MVHKTVEVGPALVLAGCNTEIVRIGRIGLATLVVTEEEREEESCSIHMLAVFFDAARLDDVVIDPASGQEGTGPEVY